jgi:hypothetical protein
MHKTSRNSLVFLSASADFLLRFLFDAEDAGDIFLRNVGMSPNYKAIQPRKQ